MKSRFSGTVFWAVYGLLLVVLLPSLAKAWGPGMHLECSDYLLQNLLLLAPAVRALLKKHPFAFIYGSVCPDMVLGKRFMRPEHNNHNWDVSLGLLDSASTPREKSFALGYLSHLAADTIAHNIYIPDRILGQFDRRRRNHVMQELIFDAQLGPEVWKTARAVARRPFPECEALLDRALPRTPLPKKVNLRVFRSGVVLVRLGGWQRIIQRLKKRWDGELPGSVMNSYLDEVHRTVIEFLNQPESAVCRNHSPAGRHVLPAAYSLRKTLKTLSRQDSLDDQARSSLLESFQDWRDQVMELGMPAPDPGLGLI